MIDLKQCKVRWDRDNYIPRKVYDFLTEPASGQPRKVAETFLKENGEALKIATFLPDLVFEKVGESLGGTKVLFQQYFKGTPIHGAWVAVHLDTQQRVFMVNNDTVPVARLEERFGKAKPSFLPDAEIDRIVQKKIKEYGTLNSEIRKESMIYPLRGALREVWKVKFGTSNPAGSWLLFIDKIDGSMVEERDVLWKAVGRGRVFRPNPVVTLDRDDLRDASNKDQSVLAPAYKSVQLKDIDPSGYLKGPYVDTTATKTPVHATDLQFNFTRQDKGFEEVMAYYHIDALQRYIQTLGFKDVRGILNHPIKINVNGTREDNSFYDPSPGRHDITFGTGGVDDAEDAEIILHEYGHALQDAAIPGFGQKKEGRAMGEGFGDYLAGSFFYSYKPAARKVKVGEWDAKGYSPPRDCLRRLDSTKRYPGDMEGEEHVDGEIWSACLWQVRKLLGRKKSDTVILESHFYLNQYADFKDGAEAILQAEKNLYEGKRAKGLTKIFKDRGILV